MVITTPVANTARQRTEQVLFLFLRENNKVYIGKEVDKMSMITIVLIVLVIVSVKKDIVKIILTKIKSNSKD